MPRVITFSRTYPSYHPKAGQPTHFIEKVYASLADTIPGFKIPNDANEYWDWHTYYNCKSPKHHTIRSGHRFKAGDKFSPRVWSGKPYRSKMIQFAPDIEVKKTWDFDAEGTDLFLSGKHEITHPEGFDFSEVEKNDGLPPGDLFDWICDSPKFKKSNRFTGQIICWNFDIEY